MPDAPQRYPLAWPAGRPRRKASERRGGQFSEVVSGVPSKTKKVTLGTAIDRLETQVEALGGVYLILSSNIEPRLDGRPRGGVAPADPAVCAYFQLKGEPYAMACDTFTEVAQNIAAIAGHIEATRRIERYGVATAAETLRAFSALPPPSAAVIALGGGPPWREVLGMAPSFPPESLAPDDIRAVISTRYRNRAKELNGDESAMKDLNRARDLALVELSL